jgi:hypothetical protein
VCQCEWVELEGENGDLDMLAGAFWDFEVGFSEGKGSGVFIFLHLCHVFALNHSCSSLIALY